MAVGEFGQFPKGLRGHHPITVRCVRGQYSGASGCHPAGGQDMEEARDLSSVIFTL